MNLLSPKKTIIAKSLGFVAGDRGTLIISIVTCIILISVQFCSTQFVCSFARYIRNPVLSITGWSTFISILYRTLQRSSSPSLSTSRTQNVHWITHALSHDLIPRPPPCLLHQQHLPTLRGGAKNIGTNIGRFHTTLIVWYHVIKMNYLKVVSRVLKCIWHRFHIC